MPLAYDANVGPDRALWLRADDDVRISVVQAYHKQLVSHPPMPNTKMHALLHVIVENQLAAADPPAVVHTVARLIGAGATRHAAIHAIGSIVAAELFTMLKEHTAYDPATTLAQLASLRAEDWQWR